MPHPTDRRAATPAQRDVIATLTRLGNGAPVSISTSKLAAEAQLTVKQAEQAVNALIVASTITKQWNPDSYVWTYTLNVPLAGGAR